MAQGNQKRSVRDVMTPNPQCVTETDGVRDVARIMKEQDTGVVPVVEGKKIIGMVTDRDIVVRCIAEHTDLTNCNVGEVMTKNVRSVREDAPIDEVLDLMSNAEVRRVPVVNGNNELVGIVSMGDIASDSKQPGKVGRAIEEISEAPPNN